MPKRNVFVSYSHLDQTEVDEFVDEWGHRLGIFTPYMLGVNDDDDIIDSTNPEYVMSQIRKNYLKDSTVTIVLIGSCTHSRRYVDWEIKSSLQQGETLPNGLIGILLPSEGTSSHMPLRLKQNWDSDGNCYALYKSAPTSSVELAGWIDTTYNRRTANADLIQNPQDMMKNNAKCKVHNVTH
jgi:hypothetical protein